MKDITTIQLTKKTRNKLASLGKKDETFDDVIIRLMKTKEADGSS